MFYKVQIEGRLLQTSIEMIRETTYSFLTVRVMVLAVVSRLSE